MNKVLRTLALLIVAGIVLVSCSKNTPKAVAQKWLNDFYHAEYVAALPLSTDFTKTQLNHFAELSTYVNDSMKKDLKKIVVTVKDVQEKGDTAIASYVVSDNPKTQDLVIVKVNGNWLVAFTKNDSYKAADYSNDQPPVADSTAAAASHVDTSATDTAKNKD